MGRQRRQTRAVGTLTADVHITRDGRQQSFSVGPSALSILDAGLDAGVALPYSCCAGICTSCCARVTAGTVTEGPQDVLDAQELAAGYVLCCQVLPSSAEVHLTFDDPLP